MRVGSAAFQNRAAEVLHEGIDRVGEEDGCGMLVAERGLDAEFEPGEEIDDPFEFVGGTFLLENVRHEQGCELFGRARAVEGGSSLRERQGQSLAEAPIGGENTARRLLPPVDQPDRFGGACGLSLIGIFDRGKKQGSCRSKSCGTFDEAAGQSHPFQGQAGDEHRRLRDKVGSDRPFRRARACR